MQDGGSADRHIAPLERGCDWTIRACDGRAMVFLDGDWIARDARSIAGEAERAGAVLADARAFAFDATMLGNWDSALIAFLRDLQTGAMERGLACDSSGLPASVPQLLDLIGADRWQTILGHARETVLAWLGWRAIGFWEETLAVTRPLSEVLLLGAILAFVGAAQLRRFGAGIFVADLVGISIVREMAAVMTATVMAGRTGGAYAAEIATMQGREEIDALFVIGIPIPDYLLPPRICALIAMMPFLYLYGCAVGLLGGFLVSVVMLDLMSAAYIVETRAAVSGTQWLIGLTKSIAFGALIAFAACRIGLQPGRSGADVGHAATSAVVTGIVSIIAIDEIFAVCANALGI